MKHPLFLIHFGKRLEDKLPVKENTDKKSKKKKQRKNKNMDRKQIKLNAPHFMYNVIVNTILIINNSR